MPGGAQARRDPAEEVRASGRAGVRGERRLPARRLRSPLAALPRWLRGSGGTGAQQEPPRTLTRSGGAEKGTYCWLGVLEARWRLQGLQGERGEHR